MLITRFTPSAFLQDYWQKKPCVIKNFISNFTDPLDEHDLAGLAQEPMVDSRLVSFLDGKWTLTQGPIEDFEGLTVGAWSLLVQGVDKYFDEVSSLMQTVNFLPKWRLDDLMVSYSVANAGVGPHTDEYDVFIVQGKGSRRWQVGLPGDYKSLYPLPLLKQIDTFTPVIDEVLQPGDAIYIPPKHPHNGTALEACLNYSIGFRAPSDVELLNGLLDEVDLSPHQSRYTDPSIHSLRGANQSSHVVSNSELVELTRSIQTLVNSQVAQQAMLQFLSRQYMSEIIEAQDYSLAELITIISEPCVLQKVPGLRPIYAEECDAQTFDFFIDGNRYSTSIKNTDIAKEFLSTEQTECDEVTIKQWDVNWQQTLLTLVNEGYWLVT